MITPTIRPIQKKDNVPIAKVIRTVLIEHGVPKVGTAYADKALDEMFETYQKERATYFVVEENGALIGGAGVAPLDNYEGNVCELQKMYFLKEARGRGIGKAMIKLCLLEARKYGFESCYLETMPNMENAQKLYQLAGFDYIDGPMGDTGHHACPVHMIKPL
ncbi:MAG: GNAT family N-acetyltransferase [Flavobacteriaceae bacterium]|nr:GNAT family N-acetyltransferase [Flavobacteriaceae bacterium]|tara:strand:- start:854 stop:1339 length:486 start_codon:yes stop_codon:yes gene_type:complete